jgi:hypothetical protein
MSRHAFAATKHFHRRRCGAHVHMYQRAMHNFLLLRVTGLPNEPNPISGQAEETSLTTLDRDSGQSPSNAGRPSL